MLFRSKDGKLIEICKKNYINDKEYYKAIFSLKQILNTNSNLNLNLNKTTQAPQNDEFKRISELIKIK